MGRNTGQGRLCHSPGFFAGLKWGWFLQATQLAFILWGERQVRGTARASLPSLCTLAPCLPHGHLALPITLSLRGRPGPGAGGDVARRG